MRTDPRPFIAAALSGLAAHPSESLRTDSETATRAVRLGCATAAAIDVLYEIDAEPDSDRHPESREETFDENIARLQRQAIADLVERVGALEDSLGVNDNPGGLPIAKGG